MAPRRGYTGTKVARRNSSYLNRYVINTYTCGYNATNLIPHQGFRHRMRVLRSVYPLDYEFHLTDREEVDQEKYLELVSETGTITLHDLLQLATLSWRATGLPPDRLHYVTISCLPSEGVAPPSPVCLYTGVCFGPTKTFQRPTAITLFSDSYKDQGYRSSVHDKKITPVLSIDPANLQLVNNYHCLSMNYVRGARSYV
ncbi:hypothetical protein J6590_081765 [Homalodisca vitripennis]|nr:hypothetical protein J6590_081765 [Homalodisca vitripennis]